jgi:hypothetical protein
VRCAAAHRLDGPRFHGPVTVLMVEKHLWDRDGQAADKAS